jgi:hypothetical protein
MGDVEQSHIAEELCAMYGQDLFDHNDLRTECVGLGEKRVHALRFLLSLR